MGSPRTGSNPVRSENRDFFGFLASNPSRIFTNKIVQYCSVRIKSVWFDTYTPRAWIRTCQELKSQSCEELTKH